MELEHAVTELTNAASEHMRNAIRLGRKMQRDRTRLKTRKALDALKKTCTSAAAKAALKDLTEALGFDTQLQQPQQPIQKPQQPIQQQPIQKPAKPQNTQTVIPSFLKLSS